MSEPPETHRRAVKEESMLPIGLTTKHAVCCNTLRLMTNIIFYPVFFVFFTSMLQQAKTVYTMPRGHFSDLIGLCMHHWIIL